MTVLLRGIIYAALIFLLVFPFTSFAQRGCCSHHGGVAGCDQNTGYLLCRDGTRSPSCRCASLTNANFTDTIGNLRLIEKRGISDTSQTKEGTSAGQVSKQARVKHTLPLF